MVNPIEALARIVASFKNENGRVLVPGFYEGVPELTPELRGELTALAFDEKREAETLGVPELAGEAGRLALENLWHRPTLGM